MKTNNEIKFLSHVKDKNEEHFVVVTVKNKSQIGI
jgi:hypothetical protein